MSRLFDPQGPTFLVVNYKTITKLTELEVTAIPTIESTFQYLGKWFSLLDLHQAYFQIPLDDKSKGTHPLSAHSDNTNIISYQLGWRVGASLLLDL